MPSKKFLSILSYEWLAKTGDSRKLLIRFSIIDGEQSAELSNRNEHSLVVTLSRDAENQWIKNDQRLANDVNLEKVVVEYARHRIVEVISVGDPIPSQEAIDSYTSYAPQDPDNIEIVPSKMTEIIIQRKFGFQKQ